MRRFVRFNLGEGLQKKSVDFAAEVAAQTAAKADVKPAAEGAPKAEEAKKEEEGPKVRAPWSLLENSSAVCVWLERGPCYALFFLCIAVVGGSDPGVFGCGVVGWARAGQRWECGLGAAGVGGD